MTTRSRSADAVIVASLLVLFAAVAVVTWGKWGNPEVDAGAELTTADLVAHGSLPYDDVRYFYGPVGLYALAGAFRIFGTSFDVAFAFGLAQALAILSAFYVLARQWVRPLTAGVATAVLLAIGFSGTAFNFVLPHTNSATFGALLLLLELIALARARPVLAGCALGLVCLTRPEFALVALLSGAAYATGVLRERGGRAALTDGIKITIPAVAIATAVLGSFALAAGTRTLFTENLWPVDFIRVAGFHSQEDWMPFTAASLAGLLARGLIYLSVLGALVATVVRWRTASGATERLRAALLLVVAATALLALDAVARAAGIYPQERQAIEEEARHLTLGMSWLPFLGLAAGAWALAAFIQRREPPLSRSWPADLALLAAAAALGLRAYNAFTAEASYAPYYAAPLVLLAAIVHERIGERWPQARHASVGALAAVAVGLGMYAQVGLYADNTTVVHTARGSYIAEDQAAPAVQGAVHLMLATTKPGDRVLVAPADAGLYFMTGRTPALYDLMLLPGLLDSRLDEVRAIDELQHEQVPIAVVGSRDFSPYGFATFGDDYDRTLGSWLQQAALDSRTVGRLGSPVGGTYSPRGFRLLALTGTAATRFAAAGR